MEVSSDTEIGRWALRKDQSFIEVFNSLSMLTVYIVPYIKIILFMTCIHKCLVLCEVELWGKKH